MAHKEACQLYIEQEIQEGLKQGKTPYSIGKDLAAWVEKLFETNIPVKTIESQAYREKKKITSNEVKRATTDNHSQIPENQVFQHRGMRPDAGRPPKYAPPPQPYSCAKQMATIAISQLSRIPDDDPQIYEKLVQVRNWINQKLKEIGYE